jgi:carbonic anhydrase
VRARTTRRKAPRIVSLVIGERAGFRPGAPHAVPLRRAVRYVSLASMRGTISLTQLLANNRTWAARRTREDPDFFTRLCAIHAPDFLWIGCADSRVPANEIVGMAPGELFVHRNIANVVAPDDPNCTAVLQYAVEVLGIKDVIVCGHYGCGGVEAALGQALHGPLERWLQHVRDVHAAHADALSRLRDDERSRRLAELNVIAQVKAVCRVSAVREAWQRRQPLAVHGWIYDLRDGLLRDLEVSTASPPP